jgi:hypothetical protein
MFEESNIMPEFEVAFSHKLSFHIYSFENLYQYLNISIYSPLTTLKMQTLLSNVRMNDK